MLKRPVVHNIGLGRLQGFGPGASVAPHPVGALEQMSSHLFEPPGLGAALEPRAHGAADLVHRQVDVLVDMKAAQHVTGVADHAHHHPV